MSAILVTGGAGFVGAYVSRALLRAGHKVVAYDVRTSGNVLNRLIEPEHTERLSIVAGEITDGWKLAKVCKTHSIDQVVHLASPLTQDVTENPMTGVRDVCLGTQTMFEIAAMYGIRRVVWASSVAVFGPESCYPRGPLANQASHHPTTVYGHAKSLCEGLARRAFETDGVDNVGLRLTLVYGAGRVRGHMSFPSKILQRASEGKTIEVPFLDQRLHWQYVEEVSDSVLCALESPIRGEGRTYNTWGDSRPWADAVSIVNKLKPGTEVISSDGTDPSMSGVVMDYDAIEFIERYSYRPSWPLEKGVETTMKTYQDMISGEETVSTPDVG